jgi:hypothetical protein
MQNIPPLQSPGRHSTCVKRLIQSSTQIASFGGGGASATKKKKQEKGALARTTAIRWTLAGHALQRLSTPPERRVLIVVFLYLNEGFHRIVCRYRQVADELGAFLEGLRGH